MAALLLACLIPSLALSNDCPDLKENTCMPLSTAYQTIKNTTDASACCAMCQNDIQCGAFTLNTEAKTCFLHPVNAAPKLKNGACFSGIMRTPKPAPKNAKNVIFFISDDLRPEMLEAYGQNNMITPNFDALAQSSTVFKRAYCQQAICGPTRNSFLSGRRPQRTKAWNFIDHFREAGIGANWTSFPGYFLQNGYTVLGGGKTYHPNLPPDNDGGKSWSTGEGVPGYVSHGDTGGCTSDYFEHGAKSSVCPDNKADLNDYTDYANLQGMLDGLRYASEVQRNSTEPKPFFLNYGVHRPHLPFRFPASFGGRNVWDAYGPTEGIALPKHQRAPKDMPGIAFTYEMDGQTQVCVFGECHPIPGPFPNTTTDSPNSTDTDGDAGGCPFCGPSLPPNITRLMRKGYYAAVTWVDYCVGQMMAELDRLNHTSDTVIALVGDHGWQLGEHNIWGKHTNFELGTHVPLIIRGAGQTDPVTTDVLVESVDIYPTVARLAGLPFPEDVDGEDLTPLWSDPSPQQPLKQYAFSEYPRCAPLDAPWSDTTSCVHTPRVNFSFMGYSVRSDTWRCVLWMHWNGELLQGDFTKEPAAVELYEHSGVNGLNSFNPNMGQQQPTDFDATENINVAAAHPDVIKKMLAVAKEQWGGSV